MTSYKDADQILGFAFGEILPDQGCILTDIFVRTPRGQGELEGKRSGLIIHQGALQDILAAKQPMLEAMTEMGADRDVLAPARIELPAWDQGPTLCSTGGAVYLCQSFGITEVVSEFGAVAAVIDVTQLGGPNAESHKDDYLIPRHVLLTLLADIPKVLAKIGHAGGVAVVH